MSLAGAVVAGNEMYPDMLHGGGVTMTAAPAVDERSAAVIAGVEAIDPRWIFHLPSSTLKAIVGHFLAQGRAGRLPLCPHPARGGGDRHPLRPGAHRHECRDDHPGQWHRQPADRPEHLRRALPPAAARHRHAARGARRIQQHDPHFSASGARRSSTRRRCAGSNSTARRPSTAWADTIVRAHQFAHTTHRPIFVLVNLMGG